jgi:hypothetical protein
VERDGHQVGERVVGGVNLILHRFARQTSDRFFNDDVGLGLRPIARLFRERGRWHREKQGYCTAAEAR